MTRVLIVDDDPVQLRLTALVATRAGFTPVTAVGGAQALAALRADRGIGAVVLDLVMPDFDGMAVLQTMRSEGLSAPVIIQTATSSLETVVSAMRQGAFDFVVKPVAPERLIVTLRNALKLETLETAVRTERHRRQGTLSLADIVTQSPAMDRALALCTKAARSPIPVLIEGETGVGKDLVARVIQGMGDRAGKPFVTVNCGAISPNLIESTLFGHKRGAFTGATADHAGKFAEAHNGTIFLDEVGELSLDTQARLLRVIQNGEIEPLGGERALRVNVRVISATNRRLLSLAKAGAFREDLYYRLNVFPIYVPPLRERREDIRLLAAHFIARLAPETGRRIAGLAPDALRLLEGYDWPGNIRQLENAIYRAIVLAETDILVPADFPQILALTGGREEALKAGATLEPPPAPVHVDAPYFPAPAPITGGDAQHPFLDANDEVVPLAAIERDLVVFALAHYRGRMAKVARALGIGRSTLYRKLSEYGLDQSTDQDAA